MAKFVKHDFKWHMLLFSFGYFGGLKIVVDRIHLAENRLARRMDVITTLQHKLILEISRNIDKVISFSDQL